MGERKGLSNRHEAGKKARLGRRRFLLGTTGVLATGALAGYGAYRLSKGANPRSSGASFSRADWLKLPRRETRPTLPPSFFTWKAADAYAVAKENPALLDQLRCYCWCQENYGHKSLLSCYVDRHAST